VQSIQIVARIHPLSAGKGKGRAGGRGEGRVGKKRAQLRYLLPRRRRRKRRRNL
jgi:hypothetical protein